MQVSIKVILNKLFCQQGGELNHLEIDWFVLNQKPTNVHAGPTRSVSVGRQQFDHKSKGLKNV